MEVFERELGRVSIRFKVVEADAGEVRDDDVAREVALLQAVEVVGGLMEGAIKIKAARFVLDEDDAFPEQVDEAAFAVGFDHGLFKCRDTAAGYAEDQEESVPEGFRLSVFGGLVLPLAREGDGVGADVGPGEGHPNHGTTGGVG